MEEGNDVDKTSELYDLSPFMEDRIIKMQTRLMYSELLPEQMKHPILLWKGSRKVELVIKLYLDHCERSRVLDQSRVKVQYGNQDRKSIVVFRLTAYERVAIFQEFIENIVNTAKLKEFKFHWFNNLS